MHKIFCSKHFFIAVVCVAFVVMAVPCVQASGVEIIPWIGKVVDKETREPVEGAVIVREWDRYILGPGGRGRISETVEEVLSNKKGKFLFRKKKFQISVPGYWVEEENPLVDEEDILLGEGYLLLPGEDVLLLLKEEDLRRRTSSSGRRRRSCSSGRRESSSPGRRRCSSGKCVNLFNHVGFLHVPELPFKISPQF